MVGRTQFALAPVATAEVFFILVLAYPELPFRRSVLGPCIVALYVYNIIWTTSGNGGADWALGALLMTRVFTLSDFLYIAPRRSEVFKRCNVQSAGKEEPLNACSSNISARHRLLHSISLLYNPRGIGWNFRVPLSVIPAPKHSSRTSFALNKFLRAFILYLVLDVKETYQHEHPIIQSVMDATPGVGTLSQQPYFIRCQIIVLWASAAFAAVDLQLNIVSAVAVTLGFSEVEDWPNVMGSPGNAWTVKRFWGRTWHQMFRRIFVSHGQFVTSFLGIQPSSELDNAVQIALAFVVSALVHIGGDYMLADKFTICPAFFLSQPFAIAAESIFAQTVNGIVRGTGSKLPRWFTRTVGYFWVCVWFSWCSVEMINALLKEGMARGEMLPISITRGMIHGHWFTN